jgi:sugar lactone lactonase YvrE
MWDKYSGHDRPSVPQPHCCQRKHAQQSILALLFITIAGVAGAADADILVSSWEGRIARFDEATGTYLGDFPISEPLSANEGIDFGSDGKLYVAEYSANRVRRFFADGSLDGTFMCPVPQPANMTFDSAGTIYITSDHSDRLYRCGQDGTPMDSVSIGVVLGLPVRMGPDGYIYVTAFYTPTVLRFRPDGSDASSVVAVPVSSPLSPLRGLAFAPNGDLYVSAFAANSVWRWNASQGLSQFTVVPDPYGLQFDSRGDLIVGTGDYEGDFYRVHPDGTYATTHTNLLVAPWATATMISPEQLILNLTMTVASFNLVQGIANSLDAKLATVQATLAAARANSIGTACNQMGAFINAVQAQSGKVLTVVQANQLIATADQIKTVLSCP